MRGLPAVGRYRVVAGDLLEVHGPVAMFVGANAQNAAAQSDRVHMARVAMDGSIQVPLAGTIAAGDKTVLEIEKLIGDAVHPKYLVAKPSIVVRVADYHRTPVTVIGAVETPGIHELRSDRLTLFGALTAAGGILKATNLVVGARLIRIRHAGISAPEDIALPVKGLNVPFSDVRLNGGETIEVERYEPDTFTVVGLVNNPGAYEYPPEVTINLMQAIATAGGTDRIADPPYAHVFRKNPQTGEILANTFEIYGDGLVASSSEPIKPGDVIVLEHTTITWTRTLLSEILQFQFGYIFDNRRR